MKTGTKRRKVRTKLEAERVHDRRSREQAGRAKTVVGRKRKKGVVTRLIPLPTECVASMESSFPEHGIQQVIEWWRRLPATQRRAVRIAGADLCLGEEPSITIQRQLPQVPAQEVPAFIPGNKGDELDAAIGRAVKELCTMRSGELAQVLTELLDTGMLPRPEHVKRAATRLCELVVKDRTALPWEVE